MIKERKTSHENEWVHSLGKVKKQSTAKSNDGSHPGKKQKDVLHIFFFPGELGHGDLRVQGQGYCNISKYSHGSFLHCSFS